MKYPNRLKYHRLKCGYTQDQIAQKIGVTQQCYHNYETGKRELRGATIRQLSAALQCSCDELLGD